LGAELFLSALDAVFFLVFAMRLRNLRITGAIGRATVDGGPEGVKRPAWRSSVEPAKSCSVLR
jgi:hypothetical protein